MHFPYEEGLLLLPRTNDWPSCGHGLKCKSSVVIFAHKGQTNRFVNTTRDLTFLIVHYGFHYNNEETN